VGKEINILVVEDNRFYNELLSETLKNRVSSRKDKYNFRFRFHSFTDASECLSSISNREIAQNDTMAFFISHLANDIMLLI
jgi:hypothetical protein